MMAKVERNMPQDIHLTLQLYVSMVETELKDAALQAELNVR
jgi:hypothetical protein